MHEVTDSSEKVEHTKLQDRSYIGKQINKEIAKKYYIPFKWDKGRFAHAAADTMGINVESNHWW